MADELAAAEVKANAEFSDYVLKHNLQIGVKSRSGGINGAHNSDVFLESVDKLGAKINNTKRDSRFPGLVEYEYQLPKLDSKTLQPTGEYRSGTKKTVYDSNVLSDKKIADMSARAAAEGKRMLDMQPGEREIMVKVDGYFFQVTQDKATGKINNAFITIPPRTKQ